MKITILPLAPGDKVVVCAKEFGPQYFEEFGLLNGECATLLGDDGAYVFVRFEKIN